MYGVMENAANILVDIYKTSSPSKTYNPKQVQVSSFNVV